MICDSVIVTSEALSVNFFESNINVLHKAINIKVIIGLVNYFLFFYLR